MLENGIADSALGASDEFSAVEGDFILRGAGKTGGGEISSARRGDGRSPRFQLSVHAQYSQSRNQTGTDGSVYGGNVPSEDGMVCRADDAIGEFVPVEYGSAPRWSSDDVDASSGRLIQVYLFLYLLGVTEGEGRRFPSEHANGRGRCAGGNGSDELFIRGYVKKGVSERRVQETPDG